MNKNNGVTVTLPDNGMCALVKKIDGRYEIDTGRIERKDIFLSPWVKTSDRLPDDDEPVLVTYVGYVDNLPHNDAIAVYAHVITDNYAGAWYWQDSDGVDDNPVSVSITHWMPIPPLPEKEEQEPWPGDDLDCPNCGAMLELVDGGMLECRLCGFSDNDTAEVEE